VTVERAADAPGAGPDGPVVVGVGNPTMGDDGLGRAVVRRLGAGVAATFAGTTGFFALEAMSGADRAVVVDAVDGEGPPGTLHRARLDRGSGEAVPEVTLHDLTFADALRSCRSAYDLPDRVVLVGVVPAAVEGGIGLSDRVEAALPSATEAVRAEVGRRERHGGGSDVNATWYCRDCDERIDAEAVDDHEDRGHSVRGRLRPDRLLAQDPWETDGGSD
jgi:hydrogenase maturation protease